jgi:hypothetical protein
LIFVLHLTSPNASKWKSKEIFFSFALGREHIKNRIRHVGKRVNSVIMEFGFAVLSTAANYYCTCVVAETFCTGCGGRNTTENLMTVLAL